MTYDNEGRPTDGAKQQVAALRLDLVEAKAALQSAEQRLAKACGLIRQLIEQTEIDFGACRRAERFLAAHGATKEKGAGNERE